MWFIPGFTVWGLSASDAVISASLEKVGADRRILVSEQQIGGAEQTVQFANLDDHRGSSLPQTINNPTVLALNKSESGAFVIGRENASGFKIARDANSPGAITVDLLIIEMS